MKGRILLIRSMGEGRTAAALLVDGRLQDFAIDPPAGTPPIGSTLNARVGRPAQGKQAYFASADGLDLFLRSQRPLRQGETLPVHLGAYAEPGKARPASTEILHKSRFMVLTPGRPGINVSRRIKDQDEAARLKALLGEFAEEGGLVVRTTAAGMDEETLTADADALIAEVKSGADTAMTAQRLAEVEWTTPLPDWIGYADDLHPLFPSLDTLAREGDDDPFEHFGVWDQLQALTSPRTDLDGGAWMTIEPTRALVAVDVNTGGDFSPASGLKANMAAIRALSRDLCLRGLGGQITVDLAPLAKKDRRQFEGAINKALRDDPVEMNFIGWTPLGHLEFTRKRERWPLNPADLPELS